MFCRESFYKNFPLFRCFPLIRISIASSTDNKNRPASCLRLQNLHQQQMTIEKDFEITIRK